MEKTLAGSSALSRSFRLALVEIMGVPPWLQGRSYFGSARKILCVSYSRHGASCGGCKSGCFRVQMVIGFTQSHLLVGDDDGADLVRGSGSTAWLIWVAEPDANKGCSKSEAFAKKASGHALLKTASIFPPFHLSTASGVCQVV